MNGGTYEKVTAALACNEATVSTPDILPVAANGRLIIKRPAIPLWLTAVSPALATVALGGVLLSTIYFTLLDWQWVADISEAEDIANPGLLLHHIPLDAYLRSHEYAARRGAEQRARAIELFDVATVGQQWREFLS